MCTSIGIQYDHVIMYANEMGRQDEIRMEEEQVVKIGRAHV